MTSCVRVLAAPPAEERWGGSWEALRGPFSTSPLSSSTCNENPCCSESVCQSAHPGESVCQSDSQCESGSVSAGLNGTQSTVYLPISGHKAPAINADEIKASLPLRSSFRPKYQGHVYESEGPSLSRRRPPPPTATPARRSHDFPGEGENLPRFCSVLFLIGTQLIFTSGSG